MKTASKLPDLMVRIEELRVQYRTCAPEERDEIQLQREALRQQLREQRHAEHMADMELAQSMGEWPPHERWLPVEGHPGYEVSDLGRVRSINREVIADNGRVQQLRSKVLALQLRQEGYPSVKLGAGPRVDVHRLVAKAFVPGDTTLTVNHKDGNRANNLPSNLEWVTHAENVQHGHDFLPQLRNWRIQPVMVGGVRYESMLDAAKAIGRSAASVASALRKGHRCGGMDVTAAPPAQNFHFGSLDPTPHRLHHAPVKRQSLAVPFAGCFALVAIGTALALQYFDVLVLP